MNLLVDAIGALSLPKDALFGDDQGRRTIQWYNPIRFTTWPRVNNRTHRELLIVDGTIGFIGGAGWADHWYKAETRTTRGGATRWFVWKAIRPPGLQSAFAENWLESSGEILTGGSTSRT